MFKVVVGKSIKHTVYLVTGNPINGKFSNQWLATWRDLYIVRLALTLIVNEGVFCRVIDLVHEHKPLSRAKLNKQQKHGIDR